MSTPPPPDARTAPALGLSLCLLAGCGDRSDGTDADASASASAGASETDASETDASATEGEGSTGPGDAPGPCDKLGVCADDPASAPLFSEPIQVVPAANMPDEVDSNYAHNNLDAQWHDGRLYFAFRTANTHFAGEETEMYVVSTEDLKTWSFEKKVALGTDVREPQFLSLPDRLIFYYAALGSDPFNFEPMGTRYSIQAGPGDWSADQEIFDAEFIPWRIKDYDGTIYLTGYTGGGAIYNPGGDPIEVKLLTTTDGVQWGAALPGQETVLTGGSSETDFVFTDDGGIVAVSRNEAGDELGFGMKICKAAPGDLGNWQCVADPKKYDSPLLFNHKGVIYLLGRRNVTETGWYDLMEDGLTHEEQYGKYQIDYSTKPKRCSLWRVDPGTLAVTLVEDLPSHGDTCFPELVKLNDDQYLVFNYTSPLDKQDEDYSWIEGQSRPTIIYRLVMTPP
ncbi:MAG: hypothetical protein KC468_07140 [Myxococcales bacterium]|nr:hypothetical protein [Myxococcales bacterium]